MYIFLNALRKNGYQGSKRNNNVKIRIGDVGIMEPTDFENLLKEAHDNLFTGNGTNAVKNTEVTENSKVTENGEITENA